MEGKNRCSKFGILVLIGILALAIGAAPVSAQLPSSGSLVGPFIPGTGSWSTLPNGGFEMGSMWYWTGQYSGAGTFRASDERAAVGDWSAKSDTTGVGGYSVIQYDPTAVTPGQTYVFSAFFYTGGAMNSQVWVDLNDIPNDPEPKAPMNVNEWQFAWSTWTAPVGTTQVYARLVCWAPDGVDNGVFIDEVALTQIDDFALPIVPEPTSLLVISVGLAGLITRRRK